MAPKIRTVSTKRVQREQETISSCTVSQALIMPSVACLMKNKSNFKWFSFSVGKIRRLTYDFGYTIRYSMHAVASYLCKTHMSKRLCQCFEGVDP